ncbi:hypothetical protein Tco_0089822 [Tanacetum coccineum]
MLEINVYEVGGDEEIFIFEAWRRAFDINKPVYAELCHEFYATYEFDETITDEDLMSKKLIKFRLGGRGHTLTILEFSRHLRLYTSDEIHDEGFETYSLGVLRNDDHFNRNELWLMSMFEAKHQNGYANVAWLIAKWLKRKGVGSQRESMICCRQFITKIARRANLLIDEVLDGRMEIRQGELEKMFRRQSYHSDRYAGLFEYMVGHYDVPLQGAYAPSGYDEPQQHHQDEE